MKKILSNLFALAVAALCSAANANAETFTFDDGIVQLNRVYDIPAFVSCAGTLTPANSGTLVQSGCPELEIKGLTKTYVGYGQYGQVNEWQVEAGKTYEVFCGEFAVLMDSKVEFTMVNETGLQIVDMLPAEGSTVSANVNGTGELLIYFNTSVTFTSAYLAAGGTETRIDAPTGMTVLSLQVKDAMNSLYQKGILNPAGGTAFAIRITGLKSTSGMLYNGTGELIIRYVAARQAIDLVSKNFSEFRTLKSYYPANDPEGILTFTFSADLANDGRTEFILTCGDPKNDNYFYEEVPVMIDGPTATVNLTGKLRYMVGFNESDFVGVKLANVRDADGNFSAGSGQGSMASYNYTFLYEYIQPVDIVSEFLPASGQSLKNVNSIEIWFNNSNMISYDGVAFNYKEDGENKEIVVLKDNLDIEVTGKETVINVDVPAEIKGKSVTVTLHNMISYDGYNHQEQVMAYYDQFVAQLIAPILPGQSIASTTDEDFVIKVNQDAGYLRYDFYNQISADQPTGWIYGTSFAKQDDGTWSAYNGNYTCYTDFTPYMVVSAYQSEEAYYKGDEAIGSFTFTFIGTTAPFEYSSYLFESISPADGTELTGPFDDFYFTIQFDGLVTLDASRTGIVLGLGEGLQPFQKIEAANVTEGDPEGYCNVWHLYPGDEYLSTHDSITLAIAAYDIDGYLVEGNVAAGESNYLSFFYLIPENADTYIKGVMIDNANGKTYNLQGIEMKNAGNGSLRPGIYIIDGKKIRVNP